MKQLASTLFILILLSSINSCSSFSPYKVPILQGNFFVDEDLEKLSTGLTKNQVQFIFGTALIQNPFRDNRWDYYNSVTLGDVVVAERKLTIFFSEDGIVEKWVIETPSEKS